MENLPSQTESSGRNPPGASVIGVAQRSACERCRGQKLRCTRNHTTQASCNRCIRARVQCVVEPTLRMGRPIRSDTFIQTNNSSTVAPELLDLADPPHPQTSSGLDDFSFPSTAPGALNVQQRMDEASQARLSTHDTVFTDLEPYDADVFGLVSFPSGNGEAVSDESPPSPLGIDISKVSSTSCTSTLNAQAQGDRRLSDSALTLSHQESVPNSTHSIPEPVSAKGNSWDQSQPDPRQVFLEHLSRLNLELHHHLTETKAMDDPTSGQTYRTNTSLHQDLGSSLPIGLMIRGLQKFQDLLHGCLTVGSAPSPRAAYRTALRFGEAPSGFDDDGRPSKRLRASNSSSSSSSQGFRTPASPGTTWTQSSTTSVSDTSPFFGGPRLPLKHHDRKQLTQALDLPTRMLFITCYINLTRFCRRVFSNIRQCLMSVDPEIIFARLSDIMISGVSLEHDGHLQIFVLIQVVSRMLDAIGAALGYSKQYSIIGGNAQQRNLGSVLSDKGATPKLMESVMKEDELSEDDGISGGGIKALQEEIWELKKLLQ